MSSTCTSAENNISASEENEFFYEIWLGMDFGVNAGGGQRGWGEV
jgi:hypothetical protein